MKRAFSLIELLVVIALISILLAVVTVSYSTIQRRSRDSRRLSDLKAIQNGLEQYYVDSDGTYPDAPCSSAGVDYLPSGLPTDPKSGLPYSEDCYITGYCVCAPLEVLSGNATKNCSDTAGTWQCIYKLQ